MPPVRTPIKTPPKGGAGLAGKRIAGLPLPVVLGGLVLAIGLGLYIRHRAGASTASAATSPGAADTAATGGASGGSSGGQDFTPYSDLASALNGLTYALGSGVGYQPVDSGATTTNNYYTNTPDTSAPTYQQGTVPITADPYRIAISGDYLAPPSYGFVPGSVVDPSSGTVYGPATSRDGGIRERVGSVAPQQVPAAPKTQATNVQPFGGVVSTKTNKQGTTVTTYASGRVVEQAKGKTPYVAQKGS